VLWQGHFARVDSPLAVFEDEELLEQAGLDAPQVTEVAAGLNRRYGTRFHFARLDSAEQQLVQDLQEKAPRL
jgi:hypothetical protein